MNPPSAHSIKDKTTSVAVGTSQIEDGTTIDVGTQYLEIKGKNRNAGKKYFCPLRRLHNNASDRSGNPCLEGMMVALSVFCVIVFFPISILCILVVVRQFERVVILRNGKIRGDKVFGPGIVCYLPCVDVRKYIDMRILCYTIPPQEGLTKDSLSVSVDAVIFYQITDPLSAVIQVADCKKATMYIAATTIRNALGTRKLTALLANRADVSDLVHDQMKSITKKWGVHVVRVDIKNITLPTQLQKAMATEAESSRLANAKIIVAKAEIESTKSLAKATEVLTDNPMGMQLRYLQAIQTIATENSHTIVFPFTPESMGKLLK